MITLAVHVKRFVARFEVWSVGSFVEVECYIQEINNILVGINSYS